MFGLRKTQNDDGLLFSALLNQDNFYDRFTNDLLRAKYEVIIESPFVSFRRLNYLLPILRKLVRCKVQIVIKTKLLEEQGNEYVRQARGCIALLQQLGVEVLITGGLRGRPTSSRCARSRNRLPGDGRKFELYAPRLRVQLLSPHHVRQLLLR